MGKVTKGQSSWYLKRLSIDLLYVVQTDIPIGGEIKPIVIEFDNATFYYKARNLVHYATYNVSVTGYTNAGNGPHPEVYASKLNL